MPLEPEDQRHVTAAQGYVDLGMFLDADVELDKVDADVRHLPEILEVRLQIYRELKKWELMQTVAKKLPYYDPDEPEWIDVKFAPAAKLTARSAAAAL